MIAIIDKMGFLFLQRPREDENDLIAQICPFRNNERCGDNCPHFHIKKKRFRKPIRTQTVRENIIDGFIIMLCCSNSTEIFVDELIDERIQNEGNEGTATGNRTHKDR